MKSATNHNVKKDHKTLYHHISACVRSKTGLSNNDENNSYPRLLHYITKNFCFHCVDNEAQGTIVFQMCWNVNIIRLPGFNMLAFFFTENCITMQSSIWQKWLTTVFSILTSIADNSPVNIPVIVILTVFHVQPYLQQWHLFCLIADWIVKLLHSISIFCEIASTWFDYP